MTIFKKKATDTQETKKLPMTGKVKKVKMDTLKRDDGCMYGVF